MLLVILGFTENDTTWPTLFGTQVEACYALLPGHGWKPCPATTTLSGVAADLVAKLPPGQHDVVGYRLGGRVALTMAVDHPDRVGRLVLISSTAGLADPAERKQRLVRDDHLARILEDEGIGAFIALWEQQELLRPVTPYPLGQRETIRAMRLNHDPRGLAAVLRTLSVGTMVGIRERLGSVKARTLLIAGNEDKRYVTEMTAMAAAIPEAKFQAIAGSGHGVHREQPYSLRRTIENFLR